VIIVPPAVIAVATPVADPMVATPVELLVQVPPDTASVKVCVVPAHIGLVPGIAAGPGVTVSTLVVKQPDDMV